MLAPIKTGIHRSVNPAHASHSGSGVGGGVGVEVWLLPQWRKSCLLLLVFFFPFPTRKVENSGSDQRTAEHRKGHQTQRFRDEADGACLSLGKPLLSFILPFSQDRLIIFSLGDSWFHHVLRHVPLLTFLSVSLVCLTRPFAVFFSEAP